MRISGAARGAGLNRKTINSAYRETASRIALGVAGMLRVLFGRSIGELSR